MRPTIFPLNFLTFSKAVTLATEAAARSGIRQSVYRHPIVGWTWMEK